MPVPNTRYPLLSLACATLLGVVMIHMTSGPAESVGVQCLKDEVLRDNECVSLVDDARARAEAATFIVEPHCLKADADRSSPPCNFVKLAPDGAFWLDLTPEEASGLEKIVVGETNLPIRRVSSTSATSADAGTCEHRIGTGDMECRLP